MKEEKKTSLSRRGFLKSGAVLAGASVPFISGCSSSSTIATDQEQLANDAKVLFANGSWSYDEATRVLALNFTQVQDEAVNWNETNYTRNVVALFDDFMYWEINSSSRRYLMQWTRLSSEDDGVRGEWINGYGYQLVLNQDSSVELKYLYDSIFEDTFCGENILSVQPFQHGIASGDPQSSSVILWSRLTADMTDTMVWKISKNVTFTEIVQSGEITPSEDNDYCVKVQVSGLEANTHYYFRFEMKSLQNSSRHNYFSLIGRAKTLPQADADIELLRFAATSCASYPHGYFNAYRQIARFTDLDFVLHLGDYIYEYPSGEYGDSAAAAQGRKYPDDNDKELIELNDYRLRHRYYKEDADLQLLHSRYTFITTWDDHETADNSYDPDGGGALGGAVNHQPSTEGAWEIRKANGVRAYNEWMPITPITDFHDPQIYRYFDFGKLAELMILDTRLNGRSKQADVLTDTYDDQQRRLVSDTQESWLKERLSKAKTADRIWKIIGQQVMMGQLQIPAGTLVFQLADMDPTALTQLLDCGIDPTVLQKQLENPSLGWINTANVDQWDGYNANRQRIWDHISENDIDNVVVLTGDIHTSWAMELVQDPLTYRVTELNDTTKKYGVEFVVTSVTSPGLPDTKGVLEGLIREFDPHIKFTDFAQKGYMILNVTPEKTESTWYFVEDILDVQNNTQAIGAKFSVANGSHELVDELA